MTIPHKIQLVIGVVLVLLLSVFVLINHQSTEVNFIFGTFVVSRALLVLIFFGAGVLVGWLANSVLRRRRRRGKERSHSG
ncbi:MAG: LapA family protein [Verrucomicrobiales bacterium]|nr:LapA family protein [Verrucomicrobiales bacterium]